MTSSLFQAGSGIERDTPCNLIMRKSHDQELINHFAFSPVVDHQQQAKRLTRCRDEPVSPAGWQRWSCKSPVCSACRRRHHVQPHQQRAYDRWVEADANNEDCSLATIHLACTDDVDCVRQVTLAVRRALRDLRDRMSRVNPAWRNVEFVGVVEVAALYRTDIPLLLSGQADVISKLPCIGSTGEVVWMPHLHVAIHHPGVERLDLRRALEAQWPGSERRVHVVAFDQTKMPAANVADIVAYGSKAACVSTLGGIEEEWPTALRAIWWTAIRRWKRGLEPLRVQIRPMGLRNQAGKLAPRQAGMNKQWAGIDAGVDGPPARPQPADAVMAREVHALPTPAIQLSMNSEIGVLRTEAYRGAVSTKPSRQPLVAIRLMEEQKARCGWMDQTCKLGSTRIGVD